LANGRLRLLLRCWPIEQRPGGDPTPLQERGDPVRGQGDAVTSGRFDGSMPFPDPRFIVRIEVICQLHRPRRDLLRPDPEAENLMGEMIPTTAFAADLDGRYAVVVTAERPDEEWTIAVDEEHADDESEASRQGDPPPDSDPPDLSDDSQEGPTGPTIRTVGEELLLCREGLRRMVIIFVPAARR
jgi:hypothetical protein